MMPLTKALTASTRPRGHVQFLVSSDNNIFPGTKTSNSDLLEKYLILYTPPYIFCHKNKLIHHLIFFFYRCYTFDMLSYIFFMYIYLVYSGKTFSTANIAKIYIYIICWNIKKNPYMRSTYSSIKTTKLIKTLQLIHLYTYKRGRERDALLHIW